MPLDGHALTISAGTRGFDANQRIDVATAAAFAAKGYRFCVRYLRRATVNKFDLGAGEAADLLGARLALSVVQHVASDGWAPSADLGSNYGNVAATEAQRVGISSGVVLWCDLEGVAPATDATAVIDYCNNWHSAVAAAGYVPGLYVGFGAGLGPMQLYSKLRFAHYWGGYNLNVDGRPAVRGLQMQQAVATTADRPADIAFEFQVDTVARDHLGGLPTMLVSHAAFARPANATP